MCTVTDQDRAEIFEIMQHFNISQAEIAKRLGMSESKISYQLNRASKFPTVLKHKIYEIFKTYGSGRYTVDEANQISSDTLELSGVIGTQLAALTDEVRKAVADGKIDTAERARIDSLLNDMQANIFVEIDAIRNDLEGVTVAA